MQTTTLYIKNMICNNCIRIVQHELQKLDIGLEYIDLGRVVTSTALADE